MAGKSGGMGDQFWLNGYDIGADIQSFSEINGGFTPLPATAITHSAEARMGGPRTGSMNALSYWNPDADREHAVFSPLPTSDVLATYAHTSAIGGPSANLTAKQVSYDVQRGQDGSLMLPVPLLSNAYGLQWAFQATAGRRVDASATAAGAVTAYDQGSATPGAFGLTMYVHLFALSSGSVTIKLQESSDNGADAYADVTGATTGALSSAHQGLRIQTGAINVERYLKVVTTGTFTNADFSVSVVRHRVLTEF